MWSRVSAGVAGPPGAAGSPQVSLAIEQRSDLLDDQTRACIPGYGVQPSAGAVPLFKASPLCRHRASRLTREAAQTLAGASGGKPAFEGPAWNGCTADMVRAARAHAHLVLQANFFDRVAGLQQEVGAKFEVK